MEDIVFIGDYECKLDEKNRLILPAGLRKQLPPSAGDKLVINRGFDGCLTLYPYPEYISEYKRIMANSEYDADNRLVQRRFAGGAVEITLDASSRIVIPKRLTEEAGISRDIVIQSQGRKFEIWSPEKYEEIQAKADEVYGMMAAKMMAKNSSANQKEGNND